MLWRKHIPMREGLIILHAVAMERRVRAYEVSDPNIHEPPIVAARHEVLRRMRAQWPNGTHVSMARIVGMARSSVSGLFRRDDVRLSEGAPA